MDDKTKDALEAFSNFLQDNDWEKFSKELSKLGVTVKTTNEQFKKTSQTMNDLRDEIDSLNDQIENTGDALKKQELVDKRANAIKKKDAEFVSAAYRQMKNTMGEVSGAVAKGLTNAIVKVADSALHGSDILDISSDLMKSGIDVVNSGVHAGASGLSTFGASTMNAGGKIGILGKASLIAGSAIGFMGDTVSELAKSGIGFLLSQTKVLIDSFKVMSTVGAVYVDGMNGMLKVALSGGMTIDQFSKAVASSREEFARAGLTVGQGSKQMAAAMKAGGKPLRDGLFALGMTMEDQAEATAKTMALMAGPSGQLRASSKEVADTTRDYAQNLRIISDITGQDAKARIEKLRQDNDTLAFNSVLNSMSEKERAKTVQAMSLMGEADQKAFRERKIYGTIVSADLNITRATNTAIARVQDEQFTASEKHALDVKTVAKSYEENSADMLAQSNKLGRTIGLAQSGPAAEAAKTMNAQTQHAIKFKNATSRMAEIAEAQTKRKGGAADLMAIQQDFAVQMQSIAQKGLPYFETALKTTADGIMKAVDSLTKLNMPSAESTNWSRMSIGQKAETGIARTIEAAGDIINTASSATIGVPIIDKVMTTFGAPTVSEITQQRIAQQTDWLDKNASPAIANAAGTLPAAATAPGGGDSQVLAELKKVNDKLDNHTKAVNDHVAVSKQILDVNHNQLGVQTKTFAAVQ